MTIKASYGSWDSSIQAKDCVKSSSKYCGVFIQEERVLFSEMRPWDQGRTTIIEGDYKGNFKEILPKEFSARTKVHVYGGVSFFPYKNKIFFSNEKDQNIYLIEQNQSIKKITDTENKKYANFQYDSKNEFLFAICEEELSDVQNYVVRIDLKTNKVKKILSGHDFYSNLRLNSDGKKLCVITWDHPNMPWDQNQLWIYDIDSKGDVCNAQSLVNHEEESVFQPEWSQDNTLYFASDKTGFWNLYKYKQKKITPLITMDAEFGKANWIFGLTTYGFINQEKAILCTFSQNGIEKLAILSLEDFSLKEIETSYTYFEFLHSQGSKAGCIAASSKEGKNVVIFDVKTWKFTKVNKEEKTHKNISLPLLIEFPSGDRTSYAFFYPPLNERYTPLKGETPPLIVSCHGGPTHFSPGIFNQHIQFWTSRGFAFVDVNYRGSTGFGRKYRDALKGNWGIVDVEDCVNCVKYLKKKKLINPDKVAIRGGSAGGFTTLACLTFTDIFSVGASYYGVSDLELLVKDTHKFESHYLDQLIGPYPEKKEVYMKRSPIHFIEQLTAPLILLQGEEDKVVPKNQADLIYKALKNKQIPVVYLLFPNEGHGFREAKNIQRALEAELYFYLKIFQIAKKLPYEIEIENYSK